MKQALSIILAFAGLFCSCQKEGTAYSDSPLTHVTLTFTTPAMEVVTRSLDPSQEIVVSDLNLYIVPLSGGQVVHRYQYSQADMAQTLTPGEYELYAMANAGYDLGEQSPEQLAALCFEVGTPEDLIQGRRLVMSARKQFSVSGSASISIPLERCVAKLSLNISTAAAFSDFTLRSIRVAGVPRTLSPFTAARPSSGAAVTEYPKTSLSGRNYTAEIYLPENAQGTVSGITDPHQRSREKAPAQATYLHIEGETAGRKVDYYIFLGGNTTDDFNVLRNHHYSLDATISGINSLDLRLSTLQFTLSPLPEVCFLGVEQYSDMQVATTDLRGSYTVSYVQTTGKGVVTLNHIPFAPNTPFQLEGGSNLMRPSIYFTPQTTGNASLTFTLRDAYGYELIQMLTTSVEERKPIEAGFTVPAQVEANVQVPAVLTLSQENYNGEFTVAHTTSGQNCTLYLDGKAWQKGNPTKFTSGTHQLKIFSYHAENVDVTFTVKDNTGRSMIFTTTVVFTPLVIQITLTTDVESVERTITEGIFTGTQADPLTLTLTAKSDRPVPEEVTFALKTWYYTRYYAVLASFTESFTNQSVTVKIPAGGVTTAKTTVASYTGNCVGFSSSARRLLRAGYVLYHEYDRGTGSSIFPVTVDVTGVQNPGIAAGSVEYRYSVVNK